MSPEPRASDADLDLIASSIIDGRDDAGDGLGDDDRREVTRRVDQLRAAIDALAEPVVPPPAAVRRSQIDHALGLGAGAVAPATTRSPEPVATGAGSSSKFSRPTSSAHSHRAGRRRAALAAVAVILVVGLAVLVVRQLGASSSRSAATSAARSTAGATTAPHAPATSTPDRAALAAPSASGSAAVPDLGQIGSADSPSALAALVISARARTSGANQDNRATSNQSLGPAEPFAPEPSAADDAATTASTCDRTLRAGRPGLGALTSVGHAVLSSVPVDVLVYTDHSNGTTHERLLAVTAGSCRVSVDRAL